MVKSKRCICTAFLTEFDFLRCILEYFFDSKGSLPDGVPGFKQFDGVHIGWLIAFMIIAAVCCILYRGCGTVGRRRFRLTLGSLILLDEILKIVVLSAFGNYNVNYLPLHLCSINIILIAIHMLKPFRVLDNFLYAFCLPTALLALVFPNWTKLPFANFMHWHSFTVHIMLFIYPLILVVGGDIKPRLKDFWRSLLLLVGMAIPVYGFNLLHDTNYMFLMEAPGGTPLEWFEGWFGNHLIGFPVILVVLATAFYLPWELARLRSSRRKEK